MEDIDLPKIISLISNIFAIVASGIVIFVFFVKRKAISSVFSLLINYSYQLTLSELKEKLERLNDNNVNDDEQREHIVNILNELMGQIKGNSKLKVHFIEQMQDIEKFTSNKKQLTEPRKRALVSELREKIRHLNIISIDELVGEKK